MRLYRSALVAAVAATLAAAAGCGSDGSGGTGTTTGTGTPTAVSLNSAPGSTGTAGSSGGTFSVKVTDASGKGVAGVTVSFSATGSATVSPTSAVSDASGIASTQVTLGTTAGAATVRATASGIAASVSAPISVLAGPAAKIAISPKTIRFVNVGDTARVSASLQDQFGNAAGSAAVTYSVTDGTLVSVDQNGLVRALRQPGSTFVIATSGVRADTSVVTVLAVGASSCTGVASVTNMNVNDVQSFSGVQYACLSGATAGAEFVVVAFNSSTDGQNPLTASVTGNGLGATPQANASSITPTTIALRSVSGTAAAPAKRLDEDFHLRLMAEASDRFRGGFARARLARSAAASRSITPTGATNTAVSAAAIPSSAKVGDILTLNVSGGICSNPQLRGLRVAAVGTRSVVLADTLNPTGGFTDADYARFAARFDTLVYPLDVNAFGTPSDFDGNTRVGILFTKSVNELTPANSGEFVGGFFNPRDLFPKKGQTAADDCPGSNEGEMFYMLVPDPSGAVNGNVRTTGFVDSLTTGILAHEFQHLISGSRRMYINPGATDFEEIWLNEGLSHIAEELLYYRESGKSPRTNLNDATIERPQHGLAYSIWKADAASNFSRFLSYLRDPGANSPYADDDELATRGATWAFLRYAADRLGTSDGNLWQRFDNSVVQGMATLNQVLGTDVTALFRDWNVANYLDDYGTTSDARFLHQSWNFRDIYVNTFLNVPVYPLKVAALADNGKADLSVRGGSAGYVRLTVPAGKEGLLTFTSGAGLPSAPFQFVIVRTN